MSLLSKIDSYNGNYSLSRVLIPLFLFLQPFNGLSTFKDAFFIAVLALLIAKLSCARHNFEFKERTLLALCALFSVALLSSVLSPYPADSLDTLRKNLFYEAVLYLAIVANYKSFDDLKPVFLSMILSFFTLSLLIVAVNDRAVLMNWLSHKDAPFMGGYSTFASFYLPLSAGYIIFSNHSWKVKAPMTLLVILGFVLTVLNNHRTQLAAVVISLALITLMSKKWKALITGLALLVIVAGWFALTKPEALIRHKTLLTPQNLLVKDTSGLNDRDSIWLGAWEMIKERPTLGYGYGWKKMALVTRDFGFLNRWDKNGRTYLYFNEAGYGKANPHSLTLQILFEIGFVGFTAFILFWLSVVSKIVALYKKPLPSLEGSVGALFLKCAVPGILASYAILNLTNGYWHESYGNLMFTLAAICSVLYKNAGENK
ncbi:O-antigen ligase family protein [bacterium]|nr:MAG: O-antigen ligase family protein [bacterium]